MMEYTVTVTLEERHITMLADSDKMESREGTWHSEKVSLLHQIRVALIAEMRRDSDRLFKSITASEQELEAINKVLPALAREDWSDEG